MSNDQIKCQTCGTTFNSQEELREHNRNQHSQYECEQCGETFYSQPELDTHLQKMHRQTEQAPRS